MSLVDTAVDPNELKSRFIGICATINRPGMEDLMA